jgi:N-acetylglucosaminyldiphosphoundecaprenol N-acetyl-beta-D-mannosaminyltransferase
MSADSENANLLSVPFTRCTYDDILFVMNERIKSRTSGYISITNTESLYHASKIPSHRHYIQNADFSCCDGIAVCIAGKLFNQKIPRLHGPDLMLKCCEYGIDKGWRHFYYGGKPGVPELLSEKLTVQFPGLITSGTYSPPFRELTPEEDMSIIQSIRDAQPDIVWVGLGLLKQESWIANHWDKIKVPWMIGVGAAFDFHSNTIKRAPKFYQIIGLEWLYRLFYEPRMLIRNFYSLSVFIPIIKELLRKTRGKRHD